MEMKQCPCCNKEIPQESNFCLFCMTKFIEEETLEPVTIKRRKKGFFVLSAIAAVLMIVGLVVLVGSIQEKNRDYSEYVGTWVSEDLPESQNAFYSGGVKLTILSIQNRKITFDLYSISAPPNNRIAGMGNITAILEGNTARFGFKDDGFGNGGTGYLRLKNGAIFVEATIDEPNEDAMWTLEVEEPLKRSWPAVVYVDEYLGEQYNLVSENFGVTNPEGRYEEDSDLLRYDYPGISVWATEDGFINTIHVDYSQIEDKERFRFCTYISGVSTYESVYGQLWTPEYKEEEDGRTVAGYYIGAQEEYFMKVYYDADNVVSEVLCFVVYE